MLILFFLPVILAQSYISEAPVKLLTTNNFGKLYNTTESEYRFNSTGEDREMNLTDLEEANMMPKEQLLLQPGGKAVYRLPMKKQFAYLMVKPGKNEQGSQQPYCNKANITVSVAEDEDMQGVIQDCSPSPKDCSAEADHYCSVALETILDSELESILITITVPANETRVAYLWQLHLSPLDDSERIEGTFMEEGRKLMRKTQQEEATNTWLTMVSIVGKTGVGKSTLASLLSGNDTMFKAKGSSHGSTTIGADISTIIPGNNYKDRMEDMLGVTLHNPVKSRPLFLIDSEGMSFRGDEVDFVTTGPVAIIANIIVWITTGRMRPSDILKDIDDYIRGLDRISMGDESNEEQGYGEFIVILNKMQESDAMSPDEKLCSDLMTWDSSDENNIIREKMKRFKQISCIGLPTLQLEVNETVGYDVIKGYPRFTQGLTKLSDRFLTESETPLNVSLGENIYEMNSTNSETIIGMLIDGANEGNIDLSDFCNVIVSIRKQNIIQELDKVTTELQKNTFENCDSALQSCTACVCQYRNDIVSITVGSMNDTINHAIEEAEMICKDRPDVMKHIAELMEDFVYPWMTTSLCNNIKSKSWPTVDHCDISEMSDLWNQPGEEVNITCGTLFLCGSSVMDATTITITTDNIYVASNTSIETAVPDKAEAGLDGTGPGTDGGNGAHGSSAVNVTIAASVKLSGSMNMILFTSIGGAGGDGGKGATGDETPIPVGPETATEVVEQGVQYDFTEKDNHECWHTFCLCHDRKWFYELFIKYDACGGKGGKGGDGGNGGLAGNLIIQGTSGINPINNRLQSAGGNPGVGGAGGSGEEGMLHYRAYHREWQEPGCDWGGFDCDRKWKKEDGGYEKNKPDEKNCPGEPGETGEPGKVGYQEIN